MNITKLMTTSFLAFGLALGACSGDDDDGDDTVIPNNPPAAPSLGAQIDRNGRAAVSTALIAVLETDDTAKGNAKDAYNAALPSTWSSFADQIAGNLAIYDGLDTMCGNQLLAGAGTSSTASDAYGALAGALADDRLYVNSAASSCATYFAVELTATGVADLSADCGGRTPIYDVVDVTYSAVAIGMVSGVGDGIDADDGSHVPNVFPFLAE